MVKDVIIVVLLIISIALTANKISKDKEYENLLNALAVTVNGKDRILSEIYSTKDSLNVENKILQEKIDSLSKEIELNEGKIKVINNKYEKRIININSLSVDSIKKYWAKELSNQ